MCSQDHVMTKVSIAGPDIILQLSCRCIFLRAGFETPLCCAKNAFQNVAMFSGKDDPKNRPSVSNFGSTGAQVITPFKLHPSGYLHIASLSISRLMSLSVEACACPSWKSGLAAGCGLFHSLWTPLISHPLVFFCSSSY